MQVVDGWTPDGKQYNARLVLIPILNRAIPRPLLERFAEVPNEPEEVRRDAVAEFERTLRSYVDQWIESGKSNGSEDAWGRNVKSNSAPGDESLAVILTAYARRNPPRAELTEDGRFNIWMLPTSLPSKRPLLRARDVATYLFIALLDSDAARQLYRCDKCREFFLRQRLPKRETPSHYGSHCRRCKGKGAAKRTASSRSRRIAQMIAWAADYWPKWHTRNGPRKEWVAEKVNAQMNRHGFPWPNISGKFVTRHQEEIEIEVTRRRSDAKG